MDMKGIIAIIVFAAIIGIIVYRNWPTAKNKAAQKAAETREEAKH